MSQQSINLQSIEGYSNQAKEFILYSFENYFYHKNFRLSQPTDEEELKHNMYLYNLLCTDNCEMINFIYDRIEGKLETKPKKKSANKISQLLQCHKEQGSCQEESEFAKIAWTSVQW